MGNEHGLNCQESEWRDCLERWSPSEVRVERTDGRGDAAASLVSTDGTESRIMEGGSRSDEKIRYDTKGTKRRVDNLSQYDKRQMRF